MPVRSIRALVALVLMISACAPTAPSDKTPAQQTELPPMMRFSATQVDRPRRSNIAMAQDFMDLSFRLESGRELPVFTRFETPIRVHVTGDAPPTAAQDLALVLERIRREAGIDIARATDGPAQLTIEFLPRRVMQRLVPRAACFVAPRVSSWAEYRRAGSAALDWTSLQTRERTAIFIPNDTAPQEIRDCLHEELAQAIGPLNDLYRLPDSVYNDDNIHAVLTGFDMLMLRATYAPELHSGMTAPQVAAQLPRLLGRLNPYGDGIGGGLSEPTPRAYVAALDVALGPGAAGPRRRAAIKRALAIADQRGWRDNRTGFAWLAMGRLSRGQDADAAAAAFAQSAAIYHANPALALHAAHADMQLATFALSEGRAETVLSLTGSALPIAARGENAALLSTLLMLRAEALELTGRASEARLVRLDSLGWGRYGFSSDKAIRARLRSIAALTPKNEKTRQP
ncbi:MAG: DUF2927 domain-containing protein [Albidovulum sp.]